MSKRYSWVQLGIVFWDDVMFTYGNSDKNLASTREREKRETSEVVKT